MVVELAWTNSNPYDNFDGQTIPINLSGAVACVVVFHNSNKIVHRCIACLVLPNQKIYALGCDNSHLYRRGVTIAADGATFTSAYQRSYSISNAMIPYQIYTIKEN